MVSEFMTMSHQWNAKGTECKGGYNFVHKMEKKCGNLGARSTCFEFNYILYTFCIEWKHLKQISKTYWSVTESMGMFCWTLSPNRSTCFYKASIDILLSLLWILDWQSWLGSASNSIYIEYEYPFLDTELWNNSIFPLTSHMYQTVEFV